MGGSCREPWGGSSRLISGQRPTSIEPERSADAIPYGLADGVGNAQILGAQAPWGCATETVRPSGGPPAFRSTGGNAMRTFDLAPLYRSTVGFDRLFSLLDRVSGFDGSTPG